MDSRLAIGVIQVVQGLVSFGVIRLDVAETRVARVAVFSGVRNPMIPVVRIPANFRRAQLNVVRHGGTLLPRSAAHNS